MAVESIWTYQDNFDFRVDVDPNSPFHYPLESSRGDYSRGKLLTPFHLAPDGRLRPGTKAKLAEAVLFGGHVGCGKSTELRDCAERFKVSYTVSRLELTKILDINNLRFSDLLIALAHWVVDLFQDKPPGWQPEPVFIDPVVNWFETRIVNQVRFKDLEGEIKTEASLQGGIPWLAKLLATMTAKVRGGASYRDELRREIRDGFFQLVTHFNAFISRANELLLQHGQGPLLFMIDGTDKLAKDDADAFFNADINQLGQIRANMIVCAPIKVLIEQSGPLQRFSCIQLPMVKIFEADETPRAAEEDALIELICKRIPLHYFDDRETLRYLVRSSGGHVRDLLRLIRAAYSRLTDEVITLDVAKLAVRDVASEYQRLVRQSDWADLVKIDQSKGEEKDRTEDRLRLLYDLVLLEYNNYWWRSHPLVRTLPPYVKAHAQSVASAASTS